MLEKVEIPESLWDFHSWR